MRLWFDMTMDPRLPNGKAAGFRRDDSRRYAVYCDSGGIIIYRALYSYRRLIYYLVILMRGDRDYRRGEVSCAIIRVEYLIGSKRSLVYPDLIN